MNARLIRTDGPSKTKLKGGALRVILGKKGVGNVAQWVELPVDALTSQVMVSAMESHFCFPPSFLLTHINATAGGPSTPP